MNIINLILTLKILIFLIQIIYSKSEGILITQKSSSIPPSSEFVLRIEVASTPIQPLTIENNKLTMRLEAICLLALERSIIKHLFGVSSNEEKMDSSTEALNDWQWKWWSSKLAGNNKTKNREEENKENSDEDKALIEKNNFFTKTKKTKLEMAAVAAAAESSFNTKNNNEWIEELKSSNTTTRQFRVRLFGIDKPKTWRRTFILSFAVFLEGKPIPAEVMVRDLSLLSLAEISAHLQLAVLRIDALVNKEMIEQTQWWLIGIILGAGILIIGCCWTLLFFWLNICVRREIPPQLEIVKKDEDNIENRRSEEVVERLQMSTQSTPKLIQASQKNIEEAVNIPFTNGKQNVCDNDLLLETSLKTKQKQQIKELINKNNKKENCRKIPKILLKRKSIPKNWRNSQKRRIKIIEEKVNETQELKKEEKNNNIKKEEKHEAKEEEEEETWQKAIGYSIPPLPPPIQLEAASIAINENTNQLPINWQNFKINQTYYNQHLKQKYNNKINNRLRPYWVADKLENIYGIYNIKNKENIRPAPPSETGVVRIIGNI